MPTPSLTDRFSSPIGLLSDYGSVLGGFRADVPVYDDFELASNINNYTFSIGSSSNVSIVDGLIKPTFSGNKAFYYIGSPFNEQSNVELTVKHHFYDFVGALPTLGNFILDTNQLETPVAGLYEVGLMARRQTNGDYLLGMVNKTSLTIYKRVGGVNTLLATAALGASLVDDTSYWLRFSMIDGSLRLEHWTNDPAEGGGAATTVTHTVSTTGVESPSAIGQYGIGWWNVIVLDCFLDDFRMVPLQPNSFVVPTDIKEERHIDIRDFFQNDVTIPRPLSDLNKRTMEQTSESSLSVIEYDITDPGELDMESLEEISVFTGENWTIRGNGYADSDLSVTRIGQYYNWRGARVFLNNTTDPTAFTLDSNMYLYPVNIAALDPTKANIYISMILPDLPAGIDTSQSLIQFTSHPRGQFNSIDTYVASAHDSAPVFLSSGMSGNEFKVPLTSFEAGSSIDWTRITALRIRFVSTAGVPMASKVVTILALRAVLNTWDPRDLLMNTRRGVLVSPVTETSTLVPRPLHASPFIRVSDTADSNPSIGDLVYNIKFNTGYNNTAGTRNTLQFYIRARETSGSSQSFIVAQLDYRLNDTQLSLYKVDRVNASPYSYDKIIGSPYIWKDTALTPIPGELSPLSPDSKYQFTVEALANSVRLAIYSMDGSGLIEDTFFDTGYISDPAFIREFGLAGWWANFPDEKDNYIEEVTIDSVSYATLRTKVFHSFTPIDGAQLFTESAPDNDSFKHFSLINESDSIALDTVKTVTGQSYKFSGGAVDTPAGFRSNTFVINDWENAYLEFDIWAPQELFFSSDEGRRPAIYFKYPGSIVGLGVGTGTLGPVPLKFIPGNWTHNKIDLSFFKEQATGEYEIWLCQDYVSTDNWWVDNFHIYQRSVAWEIRAKSNSEWVPFKSMLNDVNYGVHFIANQRGTEIQLQARALTPDAWISSYTLLPRYAQTGRLLSGAVPGDHNQFSLGDPIIVEDKNLPATFNSVVGGRSLVESVEVYKGLEKTGGGKSSLTTTARTIHVPGSYFPVQTWIDETHDQNFKPLKSAKSSSTISIGIPHN